MSLTFSYHTHVPQHIHTGDSFWDRPFDAAEVDRKETYCTDYWEPGKRFYQTWYTCDQCNSAWEQYPHEEEGNWVSNRLLVIAQ